MRQHWLAMGPYVSTKMQKTLGFASDLKVQWPYRRQKNMCSNKTPKPHLFQAFLKRQRVLNQVGDVFFQTFTEQGVSSLLDSEDVMSLEKISFIEWS